jgi:3-dehydroquinate dehydratase-2
LYGDISLSELENNLNSIAKDNGCMLKSIQSNAEHEIIETIHQAIDQNIKVIIINPAAYTHTSIAIRDALLGVSIPFYEIHISDIYSREDFRKFSYFSDIAIKVYCGLGIKGYEMALMDAISNYKET